VSNNLCNFPKDCSADAQESRLKGGRDHEEQKESDRTNDIAGSGLQGDPNAIVVDSAAFSSHEGKSPLKPPAKETQAQQRRHSSLDSDIARTAPGDPNDVLVSATASSFQELPKGNAHVNPPDSAKGSDRIQDGSDLEEQKASSCHGKNPERHLSDDKSLDKHDDVGLRTTVSVLEGNALT
jgi:hypothetical protein